MNKKQNHLFEIGLKAIVIHNDTCLILKRHANDSFGGEWDIPGGAMDEGEKPEIALLREVKEETGLDVTIGMPLRVWTLPGESSQCVGITFVATHIGETDVALSSEHTEYQWVTFAEMEKMDVPRWLRIESELGFKNLA